MNSDDHEFIAIAKINVKNKTKQNKKKLNSFQNKGQINLPDLPCIAALNTLLLFFLVQFGD